MKIPGDGRLSNAEIVAFVDLAAAEIPGWVPSEHFDEHSLVRAYTDARTGDDALYRMITGDRLLAVLVMAGRELIDRYEASERPFAATVAEVIGPDAHDALASFLVMRSKVIAAQVVDWPHPERQLAMYQLDSFLLGWMAHDDHTRGSDA